MTAPGLPRDDPGAPRTAPGAKKAPGVPWGASLGALYIAVSGEVAYMTYIGFYYTSF